MMKSPRLLVECLTTYDLQKFLEVVRRSGRNRARNQAIVLLLLDTGMRPGELCNLTLEDLNLQENILRFCGKTGERLLPFTQKTRKALLSYLRSRKGLPGEKALSLLRKGRPLP